MRMHAERSDRLVLAPVSGAVTRISQDRHNSPWSFEFVRSPTTMEAAIKRCVDVMVALTALVLSAPILLLAAALVRLTSPGGVLFVQRRVGLHGAEFSIYKLRTMVTGADRLEPELVRTGERTFLKLRNDPRITRVGRVLRKLSIDELPQLVNVLRGEMSLVGPRPLMPSEVQNMPRSARQRRFAVKPGITGLWQVSGRSACSDEERIRLDHEYVERWTPLLDLQILVRTVPAVLAMRGAA
jgi:lipopolysaccharide/colanic/teichoic acid biosynthesis glycosyltransferase